MIEIAAAVKHPALFESLKIEVHQKLVPDRYHPARAGKTRQASRNLQGQQHAAFATFIAGTLS